MRPAAMVLALVLLAAATATAQAPPPPLSPERYAAIEPVFAAAVALDKEEPTAAAVKAYGDRCATLPDGDALLVAVRGECRAVVKLVQLVVDADVCKTAKSCLKALTRLASAAEKQISAVRALNGAAREVTDPACRTALRTSKADLTKGDRFPDLLRAVIRAVKSGSERRIDRALKRLDSLDLTTTRTGKRRLRQLQEGCR